jgi:hypothetical protein
MHTTSLLIGTRAGDQFPGVDQVPLVPVAQLIVQVDAALGVAVASDTAAIEPNEVIASATAMTILRIPTMFIRSVSCFGPPLPPRLTRHFHAHG